MNKQKVTSNEQNVKSNEKKIMSNEQKVTSNEQKVTSNEQKVTNNDQRTESFTSFKYWLKGKLFLIYYLIMIELNAWTKIVLIHSFFNRV